MSEWSLLEFFPDGTKINVLDIGAAFIGETPPYQPLIEAGVVRLFGFEPDPQACARLNKEYGKPHQFFQCFAGDGRPATYYETNWGPTGSLYPPNSRLLQKFQNLAEVVTLVATHRVNTTRIDDVAEIDDVDFLKIDVQGAEMLILQNASRALSSALVVQTEVEFVELYRGQPMFADVDTFMRTQGFQFHTFSGFGKRAFKPLVPKEGVNNGFRQCLWSDAIYVRDWMHIDSLSETKMRNYAILAHDLLESPDLAHFVLAALDRHAKGNLADDYVLKLTGTDPRKYPGNI
jgi:FkbM family methyltransferase